MPEQQPRRKPGNTRRCKAKRKKGPCGHVAAKGSDYCKFHGGSNVRTELRVTGNRGVSHLPLVYAKHLTRTLQQAVEDATLQSPAEQLQLFEELALVRESVGPMVKAYGDLTDAIEIEKDPEKLKVLRDKLPAIGQLLRDAMKEVISTCEAAARVNAASQDKISVHTLHHFVNQIVRAAHDALGDDVEAVMRLDVAIRDRVKLPKLGEAGTTLTPDQDVIDMDATVPAT